MGGAVEGERRCPTLAAQGKRSRSRESRPNRGFDELSRGHAREAVQPSTQADSRRWRGLDVEVVHSDRWGAGEGPAGGILGGRDRDPLDRLAGHVLSHDLLDQLQGGLAVAAAGAHQDLDPHSPRTLPLHAGGVGAFRIARFSVSVSAAPRADQRRLADKKRRHRARSAEDRPG